MKIRKTIGSILLGLIILLGAVFSESFKPVSGATLPTVVALYEDSLRNSMSEDATSFNLVRGTDKTGRTLASSTYAFIIDEGTALEEMVIANCTGITCTGVIRGVDPLYGTSTTSSLKRAHRRGASIKITDGPQLITLTRILQGLETIVSPLVYSNVSTSTLSLNGKNLASVEYANSLSFGAVAAANETTAGFSELATGQEAASSTSTGGTGARLVLPASLATSTKPSSGHVVPITDINGTINNFLAGSTISGATLSGTTTATGPTNIASSSVIVYTTTATSTWTKPANLKYIIVEVQGAGGGGDTTTSDGGGGGGGAYAKKLIPASLLGSTETVFVGTGGGAETNGGNSSFTVTGGTNIVAGGGLGCTSSNAGAAGGSATGGDLNINGKKGGDTWNLASSNHGANGGDSFFGRGGNNVVGSDSSSSVGGENGTGYGGGGGGASGGSSTGTGGSGSQGVVIITQYFN